MAESLRSRYTSLLVFLASTHFMIHVYTHLLPAILPTLRLEMNLSLPQASLLVSIPLLVQVLTFIPAGIASDRFGPHIMSSSFLVSVIGALMIPSSVNFNTLLIGFTLLSLGMSLYHPPGLKAASELDSSKVSLAMGAHIAGGSTGLAMGPIILGVLMPMWGWRSSFHIWIPPTLLVAAISYLYMSRMDIKQVHEPRISGDGGFRSLLTRDFLLLMLVGALAEGAFINISTYITTFFIEVRGISPSLSSIIFGLGPLAGIGGAFFGGITGNKYGTHRGAAAALLVSAFVLALIPQFRGAVFITALYILFRAMVSSSMALLNAIVATANASNRSLSFGIYFVVASIAGAIVPSATSFLMEARGVSTVFPVSITLLIPTIALITFLKERQRSLTTTMNG